MMVAWCPPPTMTASYFLSGIVASSKLSWFWAPPFPPLRLGLLRYGRLDLPGRDLLRPAEEQELDRGPDDWKGHGRLEDLDQVCRLYEATHGPVHRVSGLDGHQKPRGLCRLALVRGL